MALTIKTFLGTKLEPYQNPQDVRTISVVLGANLTLAQGTTLGRKTADGKFYAYNDANADGTEVARGLLPVAVKTDGSGNISLSDTVSTGGDQGETYPGIAMYVGGTFLYDDVVGMDANGLADLQGKILNKNALGAGAVFQF